MNTLYKQIVAGKQDPTVFAMKCKKEKKSKQQCKELMEKAGYSEMEILIAMAAVYAKNKG